MFITEHVHACRVRDCECGVRGRGCSFFFNLFFQNISVSLRTPQELVLRFTEMTEVVSFNQIILLLH